MRRVDLGGESGAAAYSGWQVLDPTPQNRQSGRFRIGPVSVNAVREKKVLIFSIDKVHRILEAENAFFYLKNLSVAHMYI